jgi:CubicO group peptidase (beta-lactamase class C family)
LFKRRIADLIGMNPSAWKWGDFGVVDGVRINGGSGNGNKHIFISARELARLGHLFLNQGQWNGRALISEEGFAGHGWRCRRPSRMRGPGAASRTGPVWFQLVAQRARSSRTPDLAGALRRHFCRLGPQQQQALCHPQLADGYHAPRP